MPMILGSAVHICALGLWLQELGVYVHDWEELRARLAADLRQAYGAAATQPAAFIPTQPVVPQQVGVSCTGSSVFPPETCRSYACLCAPADDHFTGLESSGTTFPASPCQHSCGERFVSRAVMLEVAVHAQRLQTCSANAIIFQVPGYPALLASGPKEQVCHSALPLTTWLHVTAAADARRRGV